MPLATILIRMDGCAHSHISAVLGHELIQIFIHLLGILFLIYLLVCLTGFYSLEQFIRDKRVPVCVISSIATSATPLKMVFMYEEGISSVLVSERLVVQDIFFFPAVSLLLCWITKHWHLIVHYCLLHVTWYIFELISVQTWDVVSLSILHQLTQNLKYEPIYIVS